MTRSLSLWPLGTDQAGGYACASAVVWRESRRHRRSVVCLEDQVAFWVELSGKHSPAGVVGVVNDWERKPALKGPWTASPGWGGAT